MKTPWRIIAVLTLLLAVISVISLGVGSVAISPRRVVQILWNSTPSGGLAEQEIIWNLRLPRIVLACLVGAGLGTAGAGFQGLFRNPLADPFVIGASSGAALGATFAIVCGWHGGWLGLGVIPVAALGGALAAVALVYGIASAGPQVPLFSLLLAGVTTSSLISALVSLLMFLHNEQLVTIFSWLMGSLSARGWPLVGWVTPLLILGTVALWALSRPLDALTFGDESASALGLHLPRLRILIVVTASLNTAAAVAAAGIIGFVGLIAPHIARYFVGARHVLVIPASGLIGALLLVISDDIARTAAAPSELPVGVVTALLGSPFFLSLLRLRLRTWGAGDS